MADKSERFNKHEKEGVKALYNAAPFPEILGEAKFANFPLIDYWINSANGHVKPALHVTSHILIAGCGTGEEAFNLAKHFTKAKIVGIDFSENSIEIARSKLNNEEFPNLTFKVADLNSTSWQKEHDPFEFILCHAVADYVENSGLLMKNLSYVLAEHGIIYMTVNSPNHPAKKLQKAFKELGIPPASFEDSPNQRKLLKTLDKLMGKRSVLTGISDASKAYLKADIFPPLSHHHSIDTWCEFGQAAGLAFCGSMETLYALPEVVDEELPAFFKLGRTSLSKWMIQLRQHPNIQMLFSKSKPKRFVFNDMDDFWDLHLSLEASVGQLPKVDPDPSIPMPLTLRFDQLPDFSIFSSAFELEFFRQCDGQTSIKKIVKKLPQQSNYDKLRACIYRAYQYGLVHI